MNYDVKLKYSEAYIKALRSGQSKDFLRQEMSKSGLQKSDISTIQKSATKIVNEHYGKKIKQYLLEENLEVHLDDFELIDADEFENLQREQLQNIIAESKAKVNKLLDEKKTVQELLAVVVNPYFTEADAEKQFYKYHMSPSNNKMDGFINFIFLIILTISVVLLFTMDELPKGMVSLILIGIALLKLFLGLLKK